jgi:hypothetical protein
MQCKPLVSSLAVVMALMCVLLFNPSAQARTALPATISCTGTNCNSYAEWGNGTQFPIKGAQTNLTVSNPTLQSTGDWYRFIEIRNVTNSAYITAGIEKVGSSNRYSYCSGATTLNLFISYQDPTGHVYPTFCRVVPSGDINAQATFRISRNADNSYDVIMNFKNNDGPCTGVGCSLYNIQALNYHYITMEEILRNDSFSNTHLVWGSAWGWNQYQDSNLNWSFQPQANCSGIGSGGCAQQLGITPTFYWHILPQNSSTGGEIYSCEYDPLANGCTYGS